MVCPSPALTAAWACRLQAAISTRLLKGVEQRYNRAKTLQVHFVESYSVQGRARKSESGELTLRKPGRMRWDYTSPSGKLFVSDGKDVYLYTPEAHRVEKEPSSKPVKTCARRSPSCWASWISPRIFAISI